MPLSKNEQDFFELIKQLDENNNLAENIAALDNMCQKEESLVNIRFDDGNHKSTTPLMYAIYKGKLELANWLLTKIMNPVDLSLQDYSGWTALMKAASKGHKDIALALINKMQPADLRLQSKYGETALMKAANNGGKEIALALIHKMQPDALSLQDVYGWTALMYAANNGHKEIAFALIEKMEPAALSLQGKDDWTALMATVNNGNKEIALALINKMQPDALNLKNKYGETALMLAASKGHKDIALALINKIEPAALGLQCRDGHTALMLAATCGLKDIALALINKMEPAALGLQNKYGQTALMYAASRRHKDIAFTLKTIIDMEKQSSNDDYKRLIKSIIYDDAMDFALLLTQTDDADKDKPKFEFSRKELLNANKILADAITYKLVGEKFDPSGLIDERIKLLGKPASRLERIAGKFSSKKEKGLDEETNWHEPITAKKWPHFAKTNSSSKNSKVRSVSTSSSESSHDSSGKPSSLKGKKP